jgi:MarR family 2-MHQ and catechol resistance regulon transcriptional repressor
MAQVQDATETEQSVYRLLKNVFFMLDDFDRRFCAEFGLSLRQYWALQHLDVATGRSMVDLSRALLTDKSNVTSIVDRLEAAGLVTRTPATHDRRVNLIQLTAAGSQLRDEIKAQHDLRLREILSAVGASRLGALLELLEPISRSLESYLAIEGVERKVSPDARPLQQEGE